MANAEQRTISLPPEQAEFIDAQVEAGAYASASEVVRAGLQALQERDAGIEAWLQGQVGPAFDAMQANPERGVPADEVFRRVRDRHAERLKAGRGG